jgi:hypothetical protein
MVLTREQNDKWFEDLKHCTLENQLDMIKFCMLSDTSVFINESYPDGITIDRFPKLDSLKSIRTNGFCKPLYLMKYGESEVLYFQFKNPIGTESVKTVVALLNKFSVKSVEVLQSETNSGIYGSLSSYGIIILKIRGKKLWDSLKQIKD